MKSLVDKLVSRIDSIEQNGVGSSSIDESKVQELIDSTLSQKTIEEINDTNSNSNMLVTAKAVKEYVESNIDNNTGNGQQISLDNLIQKDDVANEYTQETSDTAVKSLKATKQLIQNTDISAENIDGIDELMKDYVEKTEFDGHNHDGTYAPISHTHQISEIENLQNTLNQKASSNHNHDGTYLKQEDLNNYATTSHNHDTIYVKQADKTTSIQESNTNSASLPTEGAVIQYVQSKTLSSGGGISEEQVQSIIANTNPKSHTHEISEIENLQTQLDTYTLKTDFDAHNHDTTYVKQTDLQNTLNTYTLKTDFDTHNHDETYAPISHTHQDLYADINHNHDETYVKQDTFNTHTHEISEITNLQTQLDTKANTQDIPKTISTPNITGSSDNTDILIFSDNLLSFIPFQSITLTNVTTKINSETV